MIEVVFRAANPIEEISAMNIHTVLEKILGLELVTSPAGYVVHVHNLNLSDEEEE